jgi:soluble lytic murein transglycosylase
MRPVKRLFSAALMLCSALAAAFTQTTADDIQNIKAAVRSRDHAAAVAALHELEARDPKAFVSGDYDYLLARMAETNGDLGTAMANYQRVAIRGSVLRPYALAHLSRIARSTGNLMLERLYLLELLHSPADARLLAGPASERLARNYFESANYGQTVHVLLSQRPTVPANGQAVDIGRDIQVLLGDAYLKPGDNDNARHVFSSLLTATKDLSRPDDAAAHSCLSLDLLDGGTSTRAPDIALDEHLRRAAVLQAARDFGAARLHYEAIAALDAGGPNGAEALFQIGRGLVQQNDFAGALILFSKVLDQYPDKPAAKDAMLQSASANARLQRSDEAIKLYQRFIDTYPADDKLDRAYLNIVDVLRDKRSDDEALSWCQKTEAAFAGKRPSAIAVFTETRIYIAREQWQSALDRLRRLETTADLGGATVPGGTSKDEVAFLTAYCLEQLGRYSTAIDKYLSISDGRDSYFGWRATERLRSLSQMEVSKSAIGQKAESLMAELRSGATGTSRTAALALLRISSDPEQKDAAIDLLKTTVDPTDLQKAPRGFAPSTNHLASSLIGLGLFDEGAAEMEAAVPVGTARSTGETFALATAYLSGDRADRVLQFIEPMWRQQPADYPIELIPEQEALMLYPAPYADLVRRYSSERGLDPRFLLAIMRQESRFDPVAHSGAAARGLMQFIPSTADRIATELGRAAPRDDDLYDPGTSILFGSQYLADLFLIFPGQPDAVAAAYNGGEDNMARWLGRARSPLPERYVPEIVYAQSKDYVYKVMANYRMYCVLYDAGLRPVNR